MRRLPLIFLCMCLCACYTRISAAPAFRGVFTLRQPDGTSFQAMLTGDEHFNVMLSLDGCSLIQDQDGYWCYARYDISGNKYNTGRIYGHPVPAEIISASRRIVPRRNLTDDRAVSSTRSLRKTVPRQENGPTERHGLIILAEFQDLPFRYTREDFEARINGSSSASALSYFNDQWHGLYSFQFDIVGPVTLDHPYVYYGENKESGEDIRPAEMIRDACLLADDSVDFSRYDNDGDGEADNVFVFYAGPDAAQRAGDNYIWSHQWYLTSSGIRLTLDGVKIDNYACASELLLNADYSGYDDLTSIGTFCHEYTHTFGIPDLYDTNGEDDGYAEGIWRTIDLMDAGNYNNRGFTPPAYSAAERWYFGLAEGIPLSTGEHTLRPDGTFMIMETDREGEVFLLECRKESGWDAYIGGSGLLIYHIDHSSDAGTRWKRNQANADASHQCIDLIESDPEIISLYRNEMDKKESERDHVLLQNLARRAFWPQGNQTAFASVTTPAFRFWSGEDAPLALSGIRKNADGSVSFSVIEDTHEKAPAVNLNDKLVFQDTAIIRWSARETFEGPGVIRYGKSDGPMTEVQVDPYAPGQYAFVLEGLEPYTSYSVELSCALDGISGPVTKASFTTKQAPKSGQFPYIYLKDITRNSDASFPTGTEIPLRVYNAPDAEMVEWTFDGKSVHPGPDGYFTLPSSGVLKAMVWRNGTCETLLKIVNVR